MKPPLRIIQPFLQAYGHPDRIKCESDQENTDQRSNCANTGGNQDALAERGNAQARNADDAACRSRPQKRHNNLGQRSAGNGGAPQLAEHVEVTDQGTGNSDEADHARQKRHGLHHMAVNAIERLRQSEW